VCALYKSTLKYMRKVSAQRGAPLMDWSKLGSPDKPHARSRANQGNARPRFSYSRYQAQAPLNIDPTSRAEQDRQRKMRRRSTKARDEVRRSVRCVQCGAIPGEYCKAKSGANRLKLHSVRYAAAKTGKAAEASIGRAIAPHVVNPDMTYVLVNDADVRELETVRIKKARRQIVPSD